MSIRVYTAEFQSSKRQFALVTSVILYLAYPMLVVQCARTISCVSYEYAESPSSPSVVHRFLDADIRIDCDDGDHTPYEKSATFLLIAYGLALPLLYICICMFLRKSGREGSISGFFGFLV